MSAPLYLAATAGPSAPPLPATSGAGPAVRVVGPWPRHWRAPHRGEYLAWLDYSNRHGPINTGITAAVKRLEVRCTGRHRQVLPVVMPQSEGWQASTTGRFDAGSSTSCTFSLLQGFNMSDLAQFAHYTGPPPAPPATAQPGNEAPVSPARLRRVANGGATGSLNSASIGALRIAPLSSARQSP